MGREPMPVRIHPVRWLLANWSFFRSVWDCPPKRCRRVALQNSWWLRSLRLPPWSRSSWTSPMACWRWSDWSATYANRCRIGAICQTLIYYRNSLSRVFVVCLRLSCPCSGSSAGHHVFLFPFVSSSTWHTRCLWVAIERNRRNRAIWCTSSRIASSACWTSPFYWPK